MARICPSCGRATKRTPHGCKPQRLRARAHTLKANARYGTPAYRQFSKIVLERAGHRCQAPKCKTPTHRVQAHHRLPIEDGGTHDPANGIALCLNHHMQADKQARRKRKAKRNGATASTARSA